MKGLLLLFGLVFGTPLLIGSWLVACLLTGWGLGSALTLAVWGGIGYMVVKAVSTPPAPVAVRVVSPVVPAPLPATTLISAADVQDLTPEQRARVAAILAEGTRKG